MAGVEVSTTDAIEPSQLVAIRRLLDAAFDGRFGDDDWEHMMGGHHVVVTDVDGEMVAHAAVVGRSLWIGDREFDVGYVEGVATAPDRQRAGLGTLAMRTAAELIGAHHQLGALSTGEWHFYERLGWRRWDGPSYVRRADGRDHRTPDEDDGLMALLPADGADIDLTASIVCLEREGDDW